jgi:hypothetical protein
MCILTVFRHHRLHQPVNLPLSSNVQKSGITGPGTDDGGEAFKDRKHPQTKYFLVTSFLSANRRTAPTANINTFPGNKMSHVCELYGGMA